MAVFARQRRSAEGVRAEGAAWDMDHCAQRPEL